MKPGDSGSTHIGSHASPEYHQDPEKRNFGAWNQVSSSLEAANSLITVLRQAPNLRDRDNVDAEHLALEELAIYLADCDMNGGKGSPDARLALRDTFSALVRYRLMVREYVCCSATTRSSSPAVYTSVSSRTLICCRAHRNRWCSQDTWSAIQTICIGILRRTSRDPWWTRHISSRDSVRGGLHLQKAGIGFGCLSLATPG